MSGYWHDVRHTTIDTYPGGSLIGNYEQPVDEGWVAVSFSGDEVTVIEGPKDKVVHLLQSLLERVQEQDPYEPVPVDCLPEDSWYWPDEWEGRPDFITKDGGDTWTPLCGKCSRPMQPLRNGNSMANWECINYDAHGLSLALIWADEWPDYYEEEDED